MPVPSPLPDPLVKLVAQRFRVLSEPARIKLLDALRSGPASVNEFATRTGLSQQNASKHLGVLHTAGLLQRTRTRTGTTARYAIAEVDVTLEDGPGVAGRADVRLPPVPPRRGALHDLRRQRRGAQLPDHVGVRHDALREGLRGDCLVQLTAGGQVRDVPTHVPKRIRERG